MLEQLSRIGAFAALAALSGGCSTTMDNFRPYWSLTAADLRQFKPGVATKADVERILGKPWMAIVYPGPREEVWDYRYMDGNILMYSQASFDPSGTFRSHTESHVPPVWASKD